MSHVRNGALAVAALALMMGCKKNSQGASDSANGAVSSSAAMTPADSAAVAPVDSNAMVAPGTSAALPGTPPLPSDTGSMAAMPSTSPTSGDAGILASAADDDSSEVIVARFAETMATSPSVKAYAHMLVTDHQKGLHEVNATNTKLSFQPPTYSSKVANANSVIGQLRAMPKGKAFDTAFVNMEVADHQTAISATRQNVTAAQAPAVKTAMRSQVATIQKHLDRGKELQGELAKGK